MEKALIQNKEDYERWLKHFHDSNTDDTELNKLSPREYPCVLVFYTYDAPIKSSWFEILVCDFIYLSDFKTEFDNKLAASFL